jgi:hypothetical protein
MLGLEARGEEADRHLALAERLLVLRGESSDLGPLRAEQAKRAAAQGHGKEAVVLATEAVRLVREDVRYLGAAIHALATGYAVSGAAAEAERYYGEALEALEARRQWREASAVAREWAQLVREQGRPEEAFDLLDRATVLSVRHVGQTRRGSGTTA